MRLMPRPGQARADLPPPQAARQARRSGATGSDLLRSQPLARPVPEPRLRSAVVLLTPDGQRFPARVQHAQRDALTLVVIVPLPALSEQDLAEAVVEYGIPGARVRLHGRLQVDQDAPEVLVLHRARLLEVIQERMHPRVVASLPINLTVGEGAAQVRGYTVDISAGGCLLDGVGWLRVGDSLRFEMRLEALGPPITGAGRVVRIDDRARRGVVFDAIPGEDRRRLLEYVADRLGLPV